MADLSTCMPLTRESVMKAHEAIKPYIHYTRTSTNTTLTALASTPQDPNALLGTEWAHAPPSHPRMHLFLKHENEQRVGAFKARGAFHALSRLSSAQLARGVVTHSSGNHAQALALAARTHGVAAHIVMPGISTPSKIAGTRAYGADLVFSGSTAPEREEVVAEVVGRTRAVFVPPYDHPDIMLGQGTLGLELEAQVVDMLAADPGLGAGKGGCLDAVIAPCGGGGMLSGVCTALAGTGIRVFGAEPSFEGADDGRRGLAQGKRVESVKTLTIADGLRTPLGEIPWTVISDPEKFAGFYAVTEDQIKAAMRLLLERAKVFVEPSGAVGLAVALFNEDFRRMVEREAGEGGWNVGIVLSGGNTTVEAIAALFAPQNEKTAERQEAKIGVNGERVAENVAG